MNKKEKYDLALWAVNLALKNGADQAAVSISNRISNSVEVRDKKTDKLEQAKQNSMSVKLYVDRKYSSHSTNRMNKKDLSDFITEAIASTRYLSEDEFRTLPEPELYYKGEPATLKTVDSSFASYDTRQKIDIALAIEKEALGQDDRVISVSASYYDSLFEFILVTSNGFRGDSSATRFGVNASVSVNGGDSRPESYWGENSIFFNELKKNGIGETALKRGLRKIGQRKTDSGKMSMIIENRQTGRILSPVISALNGSAIQQKNSFLTDKKGEKVFSDLLTVTDDPFIISGLGSGYFDNEGLATKRRIIIENGVLRNYYIDTYYSKKLDMEPTSGDTTNLVFKTGSKEISQLITGVEKGIMVTGFNGGNCNGSTGDFSYGIEGFFIEMGELKHPVSEMNITGNMKELWSNIAAIGNDVNTNSAWLTPSVLFEGVDFSGI
jgi:PmbA protein